MCLFCFRLWFIYLMRISCDSCHVPQMAHKSVDSHLLSQKPATSCLPDFLIFCIKHLYNIQYIQCIYVYIYMPFTAKVNIYVYYKYIWNDHVFIHKYYVCSEWWLIWKTIDAVFLICTIAWFWSTIVYLVTETKVNSDVTSQC